MHSTDSAGLCTWPLKISLASLIVRIDITTMCAFNFLSECAIYKHSSKCSSETQSTFHCAVELPNTHWRDTIYSLLRLWKYQLRCLVAYALSGRVVAIPNIMHPIINWYMVTPQTSSSRYLFWSFITLGAANGQDWHQQKIFLSVQNDSVGVDALCQSHERHPGGGLLRTWHQFNLWSSISPSNRCFNVSSCSVGLLF